MRYVAWYNSDYTKRADTRKAGYGCLLTIERLLDHWAQLHRRVSLFDALGMMALGHFSYVTVNTSFLSIFLFPENNVCSFFNFLTFLILCWKSILVRVRSQIELKDSKSNDHDHFKLTANCVKQNCPWWVLALLGARIVKSSSTLLRWR